MVDHEIDFTAPAVLLKEPSLNAQRHHNAEYPAPYLLHARTLHECIKEFMSKPAAMQHLYEIHAEPQPPLVTKVLRAGLIVEIARLQEFL